MARILVVDDEQGIRSVLTQLFEYEDHEVRTASGGAEAIQTYAEFRPDVAFLDVKMARMDGLEALSRIRESDPHAVVVMISGHGTIDTAVEATRRGAFDFQEKPLDTERILIVLRNALQQQGLLQENARLRGRFPTDRLPDTEEVNRMRAFLPDTAEVVVRGSIRTVEPGRAAVRVDNASFARIPIPAGEIPGVLERMGRGDQPGLAPEEYPFPLPPGVGSARVENGQLVLSPREGQQ